MASRNRLARLAPLLSAVALGIVAAVFMVNWRAGDPERERPNLYVFAEGFTGPVKILYEVAGAPPVPVKDGYRVFEIPKSGWFETSSPILYGRAHDAFRRHAKGGAMQELDPHWIRIRKNGLRGDKLEFFNEPKELESRDADFTKSGAMNPDGTNKLGKPYEIMVVRDDME